MNNLTPEVRRDKNGNFVTRWIRSLGKKNTTVKLPAPSLDSATPDPAVKELYTILKAHGTYERYSLLTNNATIISTHDPDLLQQIIHTTRDNTVERGYWEDRLNRVNKELLDEDQTTRNTALTTLRLALTINPLINRITEHDPTSGKYQIEPHLHLDALTAVLEDGGITDPHDNLVQAIVLINHIKEHHTDVWNQTGGVTYQSIAADAAYIADHLDQVEKILPELKSRETHDRATIELLINNEAQALREGEL